MRDHQKLIGLTAHQHNSEGILKLLEHSYKPPQNIRKKEKLPPSDYYGKVSIDMLNPTEPFSLFLWFSGEGVCIVDLMIDGKKSTGLIEIYSRYTKDITKATFWRVMRMDDGWFPDEGEKAYAVMQMYYRSPDSVLGPSSVLNPSSIMSSPGFKQTIKYQDFVTSDMLPSDIGVEQSLANQENCVNILTDPVDGDNDVVMHAEPVIVQDKVELSNDKIQKDEVLLPSDDEDFPVYRQDESFDFSRSGTIANTTTPFRKRVPMKYESLHYRITVEDSTVVDELVSTIRKCVGYNDIIVFGKDVEGDEKEIQMFDDIFNVVSLTVKAA